MDVKLINPFLSSIVNVLSTMAKLELTAGKPTVKTDDVARGVVTGLISMESDQARGSLAISFSKAVILEIVNRMLGMEATEVDDTARDLTGEITNMVMGGAKNLLLEQGYDFGMSTPEVLTGDEHVILHPFSAPKILLPLSTESGELYVEICFETK